MQSATLTYYQLVKIEAETVSIKRRLQANNSYEETVALTDRLEELDRRLKRSLSQIRRARVRLKLVS